MTVLRRDPSDISNYFDALFRDIGHRGSSFTDIDGLTHDGRTNRFLFMEFKEANEQLKNGQRRALSGLALLPNADVWVLRRSDGLIEKSRPQSESDVEVLSEDKLRDRFWEWWNPGRVQPIRDCPHGNGSLEDCSWCWKEHSA